MSSLVFDNREYSRGYGFPFTCFQIILGIGFLILLLILIMPANTFTIPDAVLPLFYVIIPVSFVGFPLVTVIKHGYRKLLRESELNVSVGGVAYKRMVDKLWTVVGHVQEFNVYETNCIERVEVSRRYYTCYGSFCKEVINNGRRLSSQQVTELRIPRAYSAMERIMDYGKH